MNLKTCIYVSYGLSTQSVGITWEFVRSIESRVIL